MINMQKFSKNLFWTKDLVARDWHYLISATQVMSSNNSKTDNNKNKLKHQTAKQIRANINPQTTDTKIKTSANYYYPYASYPIQFWNKKFIVGKIKQG